ncbi:hypothetical protein [Streptomyces sp. NPDC058385]|uniref:hypothetical protein n=1 Tax=Streptomyces sp. NPDC058385 TaxID=3346473 RepID=UPI00365A80B7
MQHLDIEECGAGAFPGGPFEDVDGGMATISGEHDLAIAASPPRMFFTGSVAM